MRLFLFTMKTVCIHLLAFVAAFVTGYMVRMALPV
jgi:hypothetical protein